jgi:oligopeptide transport system ATP-binding protein
VSSEYLDSHPSSVQQTTSGPVLEVDDLHVEFRTRSGVVHAVNGISYSVDEGETLAILGESGSGKSVSAQAIMGILDVPPAVITGGGIHFQGRDILKMTAEEQRQIRGPGIAMIFQDALSSLNPVYSVGFQIGEMFRAHRGTSKKEAKQHAVELMDRVRIPAAAQRVNDYPHQFSGGMRQRVMIAMALINNPAMLIADEPTTALDVTTQAQILRLMKDLQDEYKMAIVMITHDLGVVAELADDVIVMYGGKVVEQANVNDLFVKPEMPYTWGLLGSLPRLNSTSTRLDQIPGQPPSLLNPPSGCPFHPRCEFVMDICRKELPALEASVQGIDHRFRCHLDEEARARIWNQKRAAFATEETAA